MTRSEALRFGVRFRDRLKDEHLLLDQQSFGDYRTQTAGAEKPSQSRNEVNQQDDQVAHREILADLSQSHKT